MGIGGNQKGALLGLGLSLAVLSLTGCDEGLETVGPEGGIVTSADGRVTLDIPPGALDEEVLITIGEVDDGPEGAVGPVFEIEPRYLSLNAPAALTVDLATPANLATDSARSLETLEAASISTEGRAGWTDLADHSIDFEAETVTASVMFFSTYALVESP